MMGLPEGHVTGMGFTRRDEFTRLGNGVVPQQAALAIRGLVDEEWGDAFEPLEDSCRD